MKPSFHTVGVALGLCAAWASAAAQTDAGKAAERCEDAVSQTITRVRGREARDVQFAGAKRALSAMPDDETGVKGEGRYRSAAGGSVPFAYSCAFNARTGATSGVVFRELGARPAAAQTWQPDLSKVSPDDCETAVAAVLKEKHPRVGRIAFGADTRKMQPAPNQNISLEGQGSLQRAAGMNPVPFNYRCVLETRSGKVLAAQADD